VVPGMAILGGSNLDEGTEFMDLTPKIPCNATQQDFEYWARLQFGDALGEKVPPLYGDVEQPAPLCRAVDYHHWPPIPLSVNTSKFWQAAMRSVGDAAILCRTRDLLRAAEVRGGEAWWYYFVATPISSINEDPDELKYMGAFHGAEVPFVWKDTFELSSKGEQALSAAMGCYWTNFATTGNPNTGSDDCVNKFSLPQWPSFGGERLDALMLSNTTIGTMKDLKREQCDVFQKYQRPDQLYVKMEVLI